MIIRKIYSKNLWNVNSKQIRCAKNTISSSCLAWICVASNNYANIGMKIFGSFRFYACVFVIVLTARQAKSKQTNIIKTYTLLPFIYRKKLWLACVSIQSCRLSMSVSMEKGEKIRFFYLSSFRLCLGLCQFSSSY